jgi:hypothetical protein
MSMTMMRRTFAALLIALTLLPFTAPFPTCDIAALFGGSSPATSHPSSSVSAVEDGSHTVALAAASTRIVSRIKSIARTEAPAGLARMARAALSRGPRPSGPSPLDSASLASLRI